MFNLRMIFAASTVSLLASCAGTAALLGGGGGGGGGGDDVPAVDTPSDVERLSDVTLAADATPAAIAAPSTQGGFFAGLFSSSDTPDAAPSDGSAANVNRTGPDANVVPFGTVVPFGEIATVCDAPANQLGTRIAGVSGYEVFDSIPNSTAPRPHYIKGFSDGCVRQFTAALSLMGDIGTHEVVRYTPQNASQPYSATDNAYEAIKASFCRVRHGAPCGSNLEALAGNTTFLSVYERFGTNGTWFEILLHDGAVAAVAMEDN